MQVNHGSSLHRDLIRCRVCLCAVSILVAAVVLGVSGCGAAARKNAVGSRTVSAKAVSGAFRRAGLMLTRSVVPLNRRVAVYFHFPPGAA